MYVVDQSAPVASIQRSVLDGLCQVWHRQVFSSVEVGDSASDFEDTVVGPGRESLLLHCPLKEAFGIRVEFAMGADLASGHLGVGKDPVGGLFEAMALEVACSKDASTNLG